MKTIRKRDLKDLLGIIRDIRKNSLGTEKYPTRKWKKRLKRKDANLKHKIRHKKKSTKKTYWLLGI